MKNSQQVNIFVSYQILGWKYWPVYSVLCISVYSFFVQFVTLYLKCVCILLHMYRDVQLNCLWASIMKLRQVFDSDRCSAAHPAKATLLIFTLCHWLTSVFISSHTLFVNVGLSVWFHLFFQPAGVWVLITIIKNKMHHFTCVWVCQCVNCACVGVSGMLSVYVSLSRLWTIAIIWSLCLCLVCATAICPDWVFRYHTSCIKQTKASQSVCDGGCCRVILLL